MAIAQYVVEVLLEIAIKWAYRGDPHEQVWDIIKTGRLDLTSPTAWNPRESRLYVTDSAAHAARYARAYRGYIIRFPWPADAIPDLENEWFTRMPVPAEDIQINTDKTLATENWKPILQAEIPKYLTPRERSLLTSTE